MTGREIEYLPLAELAGNPRNPKTHNLPLLDASMGRFGFVEPIVRDGRTGYVISGHGRKEQLLAMEAEGQDPPDGIRVDESGRWLAPVVAGWSSRSDAEADAALVALNRTTEVGGWNDEALLELLDGLASSGAGFDGVGMDESDRDALAALLRSVDSVERDLDSLADEFGEPAEDDHLVRIVLYLPADLAAALNAELAGGEAAELIREWLGLTV